MLKFLIDTFWFGGVGYWIFLAISIALILYSVVIRANHRIVYRMAEKRFTHPAVIAVGIYLVYTTAAFLPIANILFTLYVFVESMRD